MKIEINLNQAKQIVLQEARNQLEAPLPFEIAINEKFIIESEHGWIIPWNSKKYIQTDNWDYAVAPGLGCFGVTIKGSIVRFMGGHNQQQRLSKIKEENKK